MELILKNKIINGDLEIILNRLKNECGKPYLFNEIKDSRTDIITNCCYHKGGREEKPSATFYKLHNKGKIEFGKFHCFSCGRTASLPQVVAECFDEDLEFGENWLINNFGDDKYEENLLPEIELPKINLTKKYLSKINPKILEQFKYYHPYMEERKLTKPIIDKFNIGYDPLRDALTFPVYDEKGNLEFITARSVNTKRFWIPPNVEKGKHLYLLNYALQEKVPILMITEGQIDALYSWVNNFPCCATLGGISKEQIKLLNNSGIRIFITAFDNDEAGNKFTQTFNYFIRKDVLVYRLELPKDKKDLNELSGEEFDSCLKNIGITWRINGY